MKDLKKKLFASKKIEDLIYYIPSKLIPAFVSFLGLVVYTRVLTPYQYGIYNLIISTVVICTSIFFGWISQSSIRFYKKYKINDKEDYFLTTIELLVLLISIIILTLFYVSEKYLLFFFNPEIISYFSLTIFLIPLQGFFSIIINIRRARRESIHYSSYVSFRSIFKFFVAIFLFYITNLRVYAIIIGMLVSNLLIVVFEIYNYSHNLKINFINNTKNNFKNFIIIFKEISQYGFPLIGVSITGLILSIADRYMIQYFMNSDSVGIYSAGYNLAKNSIQNLSMLLLLVGFPVIVNKYEKKGEKAANVEINKFLNYFYILLVPSVFGISILSKDIVTVFLGSEFINSYNNLPWITIGVFAYGLTMFVNKPFELKKKTTTIFVMLLFSSIINIFLNMIFIPKYGINGAAYATFLSYVFYLGYSFIKSKKIFPLKFEFKTFFKTILASIFMTLFLFGVSYIGFELNLINLIIKILLGTIVYFSFLYLLKEKTIKNYFFKYWVN